METGASRVARLTGIVIVVFVCTIPCIATLLFFAGIPVSSFDLWFALVAGVGAAFAGGRHYFGGASGWRAGLLSSILFLAILSGCIAVAGRYYDLSYDGQFYHQEGIIRLAEGWNPVLDPPLQGFPERNDHDFAVWVNHYPKGAWICAASIYQLTHRLEQGKAIQLLLLVALGLVSFSAFSRLTGTWAQALVLSALLACNPVSLNQIASFYVDGLLAATLSILGALAYLYLADRDRLSGIALGLCLVFLINLKFTGLVYGLLLVAALVGLAGWYQRASIRRILIVAGPALILGTGAVGFQPYVTNTIQQGHPFHPLMGRHKMDIVVTQFDHGFLELNRIEKLLMSVFSESANDRRYPRWKVPFSIHPGEFRAFVEADTRIGGFGPWFGGALLVALVVVVLSTVSGPRRARPLVFVIAVVLGSVLLNPEGWWARFAPQLWLVPIGAILVASEQDRRLVRGLGTLLMVILEIDLVLIGVPQAAVQYALNQDVHRQLEAIAAYSQRGDVTVRFNWFEPLRVRLAEAGVRYREVPEVTCAEPIVLLGSRTQVCAGDLKWDHP